MGVAGLIWRIICSQLRKSSAPSVAEASVVAKFLVDSGAKLDQRGALKPLVVNGFVQGGLCLGSVSAAMSRVCRRQSFQSIEPLFLLPRMPCRLA